MLQTGVEKEEQIAWTKPPKGCYKLNYDTSYINKNNIGAVGGVLKTKEKR